VAGSGTGGAGAKRTIWKKKNKRERSASLSDSREVDPTRFQFRGSSLTFCELGQWEGGFCSLAGGQAPLFCGSGSNLLGRIPKRLGGHQCYAMARKAHRDVPPFCREGEWRGRRRRRRRERRGEYELLGAHCGRGDGGLGDGKEEAVRKVKGLIAIKDYITNHQDQPFTRLLLKKKKKTD
jgi:hypothetical protein